MNATNTTITTTNTTTPTSLNSVEDVTDISLSLAEAPRFPKTRAEQELKETIYEHVFEFALDYIASGTPLTSVIRNDPRNIDYGRFLRWVKKSPHRYARFVEAQEIAAEILVDKMDHLTDELEDAVNLKSLDAKKFEFELMKYKAANYNRKKFGNSKHVELTTSDLDDNALKSISSEDLKRMVIEQAGIDPESINLEDGDE